MKTINFFQASLSEVLGFLFRLFLSFLGIVILFLGIIFAISQAKNMTTEFAPVFTIAILAIGYYLLKTPLERLFYNIYKLFFTFGIVMIFLSIFYFLTIDWEMLGIHFIILIASGMLTLFFGVMFADKMAKE